MCPACFAWSRAMRSMAGRRSPKSLRDFEGRSQAGGAATAPTPGAPGVGERSESARARSGAVGQTERCGEV